MRQAVLLFLDEAGCVESIAPVEFPEGYTNETEGGQVDIGVEEKLSDTEGNLLSDVLDALILKVEARRGLN